MDVRKGQVFRNETTSAQLLTVVHIRTTFRHKLMAVSKGASNNKIRFKSAALLPSIYCCSLVCPKALSLFFLIKGNWNLESAARVFLQIQQDSKAAFEAKVCFPFGRGVYTEHYKFSYVNQDTIWYLQDSHLDQGGLCFQSHLENPKAEERMLVLYYPRHERWGLNT